MENNTNISGKTISTAVLLDIGAHNGQSIERLYKEYIRSFQRIVIHSFEPIPENFAIMRKTAESMMAKYQDLQVFTHNFAMDSVNRLAPFYCYGMHTLETNQYSSLLPFKERDEWLNLLPDQPKQNLNLSKTILVSCHTGNDFLDLLGIKEVEYLKIDTQGNDYNVLLGFGDCLDGKRIKRIEVECQKIELYDGAAPFEKIDDYLKNRGYDTIKVEYQADGYEYVLQYVSKDLIPKEKHQVNIITSAQTSVPKIDVIVPPGFHSWNVGDGWINTINKKGMLGNIFKPQPGNNDTLFNYMKAPQADLMLMLGFDHHLPFLHNDDKKREIWKNSNILKVLLAQETVLQDCYPDNEKLSASALQCVDLVLYNPAGDREFYERFETPSYWQPFGVDETVFINQVKFNERLFKPYFRGKTQPIGLPHTYQRRRELLNLLLQNKIIDYKEFTYSNSIDELVREFNTYAISLNLPAVFSGFTTRVFESMASGCTLITPAPTSPEEENLFTDKEHLLFYDVNDTREFLEKLSYALSSKDESGRIAKNGYEEVISKHTLNHRLDELLGMIDFGERDSKKNDVANQADNTPLKVSSAHTVDFFTIVLNGKPFIDYHIDIFKELPFNWHWHIIEGVAELKHDTAWSVQFGGRINNSLHKNGLSNDGTTEYLDELKSLYPENISIYRKNKGAFWNGKLEMVNAPISAINNETVLWQIDSDEIWTKEQLITGVNLFYSDKQKTAAYYYCTYFTGKELVITSRNTYGNNTSYEWLRTWNYKPGDKWMAHEPPKLCREINGTWVDLAAVNPVRHSETESNGLVFQHYAYVIEAQLKFKEVYYGYKNALTKWKELNSQKQFPVLLKQYFPWVNDSAVVDTIQNTGVLPVLTPDNKGNWKANKNEKKLLFLRSDSIGDNVLAGSMLIQIKQKYSDYQVIVICQEHIKEIYQFNPVVNSIVTFNKLKFVNDENYRESFLNSVKAIKADVLLNSVYSSDAVNEFIAVNSGAKIKIAHKGDSVNIDKGQKDELSKHYNLLVESTGKKNEIERHADFLNGIGCNTSGFKIQMYYGDEDKVFAENYFISNGLNTGNTIILAPFAQNKIRDYKNYVSIIKGLPEYKFIIIGNGKDFDGIEKNIKDVKDKCFNLAGKTTILQAAALIDKASLFVGSESAGAHIAAALDKKNIVIMGGGHFGRFFPYSNSTALAVLPLNCFGCNWACKYERNLCVNDVKPQLIIKTIKDFISLETDRPCAYLQFDFNPDLVNKPIWKMFNEYIDVNKIEVKSFVNSEEFKAALDETEFMISNREYKDAIDKLSKMLVVFPENLDVLNNLSVVNILTKDFESAAQTIKTILDIDQDNEIAMNNLSYLERELVLYKALMEAEELITQDNLKDGNEILQRIIETEPDYVDALNDLAVIRVLEENYDEAYNYLLKVLEIEPGNETAGQNLQFLKERFQHQRVKSSNPVKVSAIVSTYNSERFIEGCIQDLLNQTLYKKGMMEIVIVNSNSTQNEDAIISKYLENERIVYIKTEERETVYKAWNRGIKAAQGTYITNANTDDRHRFDALEVMADYLDSQNEVSLVYATTAVTFEENGSFETTVPSGYLFPCEFDIYTLFKICYVGPQPMWRKELHASYGYFDDSYVSAGDYEFWLRIALREKFAHIPKVLGLYLISPGSIEHTNQTTSLRESNNAREKHWFGNVDRPNPEGSLFSTYKATPNLQEKIFSIIIPTYNRPESLEKALRSIESQTFQDFEVVVINDGNVDVNTCLMKFEKKFQIQFIQHIINQERSASRNNGIVIAKGENIIFLDDDDEFYPNHLQTLYENLDKANVIYTDAERAVYKEDKKKFVKKYVPYSMDYNRNKLLIANIAPINCFCFKKAVLLNSNLFNQNLNVLEDWELLLRISKQTDFYHIKKITALVNWHNDGTTTTSSKQNSFADVRDYIYKMYENEIKNIENVQEIVEEFNSIWENDFIIPVEVSIIVPLYNQVKYTKTFYKSLIRHTSEDYEIIFINNGSEDATAGYLDEIKHNNKKVVVISNKENLGFPKAVNQGIKKAKGNYIVIANNDIVVTKDWLGKMVDFARKNKKAGIIGTMSNSVSGAQLDKNANYNSIDDMHKYAAKIAQKNEGLAFEFPRVAFLCTLVKKELVDLIGGLDERFSPGNFEDDDYCLRAQLAGFKTVILQDVFIHHYGSKSFKSNGETEYLKRISINKQIFVDKWGGNSDDIWLRNMKVKERRIDYPLIANPIDESIERGLISIEEKEFGIAYNHIGEALHYFNSGLQSAKNYSYEDFDNLHKQLSILSATEDNSI